MVEKNTEQENGTATIAAFATREDPAATPYGEQHLERLATSFEVSARRWELIVYPALFAFIVLACYFFYLIYNLTHDVAKLSVNVASLTASIDSMASNLGSITGNMQAVQQSMAEVNETMQSVSDNMHTVSRHMGDVSYKMDALAPMQASIDSMENSTRYIAISADRMGYHIGSMNNNIGRPMSMMNAFMPW